MSMIVSKPQAMRISILLLHLFTGCFLYAQNPGAAVIDSSKYKMLRVKPSHTHSIIHTWDTAHAVYYNPGNTHNKILLFLAGTNGTPNNPPLEFLKTALEQGYRVIALSYITVPAVAQICKGGMLDTIPDCAALFRQNRIYGNNDFPFIKDEPHDAIVPRLTYLLKWLSKNDGNGKWAQYLTKKGDGPQWSKIAVAGQSQGGGMSQYLGQKENVARVISFSGGWDYANSTTKQIAGWYSQDARTPLKNWYATYHINELATKSLADICATLKIPTQNTFALDKPLMNANSTSPNPFHGEGVKNATYKLVWITMLGNGAE